MAKTQVQIEFEAETSKFTSGITKINKEITNLNKQLRTNSTQLEGNSKNVDLLNKRKELLQTELEKTDKNIELINKTLDEAKLKFGEDSEEVRKWQNKLEDAKNKQAYLKNEIDKTNKSLNENSSKLSKVKTTLENVQKTTEKLSKKMTVLSGALVGIGTAATKASINFESAFTGVKKTVDATDEELEELKTGIRDMAKELPASAVEISNVAEAAGQLGIKTEDILSFTRVMIDLGEATNLEATEAASALAKFANVTKMSSKDYSKLGSTIVDLGNNFATTERDIVEMATRLAATGELAGLSEPQILALSAAMSSVGIEAEAGGSAMSKLLKKIQVAVELGGSDLKKYAEIAGMTSKQFKKAFEQDSVNALSAFIGGLNDTKRNGKSAIAVLDDMGLSEVRLSNTILSLSNASGVMKDAIGRANAAWDENNALAKEAATRYGTTESKIKILKNNVVDLGISFGNLLIPKLNSVTEKLNKFVNWLNNLSPEAKNTILSISKMVLGLTSMVLIFNKGAKTILTTIDLYKKLKESTILVSAATTAWNGITKAFTVVQGLLNTALLGCPITWIIAAIAALVAAFVLLWNKCDWFREFWQKSWENIKKVVQTSIDFVVNLFQKIISFFTNNWKDILIFIANPFAGAFKLLYKHCDVFRNFVDNFVQKIKSFFSGIGQWFDQNLIQPVTSVFSKIGNILNQYIVQPFMTLLNNYIIPIVSKIIEIIAKIGEIIVAVFVGLSNWVNENIIQPILNEVLAFKDLIVGYATEIWNNIVQIFIGIGQWFSDRFTEIQNVFANIGQWFSDRFTEAILSIQNVFANIGQWFSEKYNQIKNVFAPVGKFFKEKFNEAYSAVKSIFSNIGDFFGSLWSKIKTKFSSLGKTIGDAISNSVKSGLNGVISLIENTINKAIKLINGAINLINKLPGVSVSKISELKLPRLKTGIDFVPSDYYPAYLDYGERVLTKEENALYNKLGGLKGLMSTKLNISNDNSKLVEYVKNIANRPLYFYVGKEELAEATAEASENVSNKRMAIKSRGVEL